MSSSPRRQNTIALPESFRLIVIPASFSDLALTFDSTYLEDLLNKGGYSFSGAEGSVKDYLADQFLDRLSITLDLAPAVTVSKSFSHYGANTSEGTDADPVGFLKEVCNLSDEAVDFSAYDAVYVLYAGGNPADGGATDDHIWPRAAVLESGDAITLDGASLKSYALSSELMRCADGSLTLSSIGPICHEISHLLGLPDMYDSDYDGSGGIDPGLWTTSVMSKGCYNNDGRTPPMYNAVELEYLGLAEPERISEGNHSLKPLTSGRSFLRMDGGDENEYYLFEVRSQDSWDKYLEGSGMLVYHIDRTSNTAGYSTRLDRVLTAGERWLFNEVNSRPDHPCCDLIEADPEATSAAAVFFPRLMHTALSATTVPAITFYDGTVPSYSLSSISKSSEGVSFKVEGPVALELADVYQNMAILAWSISGSSGAKNCSVSVADPTGETVFERNLSIGQDGLYHCRLDRLAPLTTYTLSVVHDSSELQDVTQFQFTTRAIAGKTFIYMVKGGRIPLCVYNADNVEFVTWKLDGNNIRPESDGYYTLPESGELRAHVHYKDGNEEILIKRLKK